MRPRALKANRTLMLLEPAEFLLLSLEELLGVGELLVELDCVVDVGPDAEEDKVTPCVELAKVQTKMVIT